MAVEEGLKGLMLLTVRHRLHLISRRPAIASFSALNNNALQLLQRYSSFIFGTYRKPAVRPGELKAGAPAIGARH